MALKHVKLPNNSVVDINDARNVVIGDGVNNAVSLTTAQYEALTTKDPNTIYVITDAQPGGGEENVIEGITFNGTTVPVSNKIAAITGQDALVSGTNIKTINNQSLLGSGNITISGGSGTDNVFIATYGTTTYADISSAISAGKAIFCKYGSSSYILSQYVGTGNNKHSFVATTGASNSFIDITWYSVDSTNAWSNTTFSAIENNSIKTSISSSSTNDDIPSALAAYNFVGSLNTTNTTAQTTSASEKLTGTINLHKVAKTGSFNDLLNKPDSLPAVASGDSGKFLAVTETGGTHQWDKVDWIHAASGGVELAYGTNLYAVGSLGQTMIYSGGIHQDSFTDWSWIKRGATNNMVTLQDTLDAIGLPSVSANDIGSMLYVSWDSTKGYYWEKSTGSFGPSFVSNQLSCGFNCSFAAYGSFGSTSITTEGINKSQYSDWSWITTTYSSGNTNVTKTLQSDLDLLAPKASPALTGTPTAPTASSGTNTTQIATTAFVQTALSGKQNTITVSTSEPTSGQGSNGDIWIVI